MEPLPAPAAPDPARLEVAPVAVFYALACALAWLVALPLWLDPRHLAQPLARVLLPAMMLTPSLAVAAVVLVRRERGLVASTGLRLSFRTGWPCLLLAWAVPPVLCFGAMLVGRAMGLVQLDLTQLSGLRALLRASGAERVLGVLPIRLLAGVMLAQTLFLAPLVTAPFMLGEEWGWRGFLLPRLLPLGQWPALVLSGALWGLWHAPAILLGHNYPLHPRLGVLLMVIFCVLLGVLFGWLRLASGSVWPAVVAHGALNASAGLSLLLVRAGTPYDGAQAGITGWSGWILPALAVALIAVLRPWPRAPCDRDH